MHELMMAKCTYLKFALEEGTKYKGYKNPDAKPYVGYKILRMINVYEQIPAGDIPSKFVDAPGYYEPDLVEVFERLDLIDYINSRGIRDVWMHYSQNAAPDFPSFDPEIDNQFEKKVVNFESRMSTPQDIEAHNSYDNPTLIANHTYIIHTKSFVSPFGDFPHAHGHQIESMLYTLNYFQDGDYKLFWNQFSGWGLNEYGDHFPIGNSNWEKGRCGNIHFLPNSEFDYDYWNNSPHLSDIENWNPQQTGEKMELTADYVHGLLYDWPRYAVDLSNNAILGDFWQHRDFIGEGNWYLYWMQNIPHDNNGLETDTGSALTNWWDIIYQWDTVVTNNIGLHEGTFTRTRSRSFRSFPKKSLNQCSIGFPRR